ncbi:hypothetical protein V8C86DRAFT_881549 [Haematococcus lacustris]
MKGSLQPDEFLYIARRVEAYGGVGEAALGDAGYRNRDPFVRKMGAYPKVKKDLLTPEQKVYLWGSSCYLCGRSPALGIDRLDSNGSYTPNNALPCCSNCNYMKSGWNLDDFEAQLKHILAHTRAWVLNDVGGMPLVGVGTCPRVACA